MKNMRKLTIGLLSTAISAGIAFSASAKVIDNTTDNKDSNKKNTVTVNERKDKKEKSTTVEWTGSINTKSGLSKADAIVFRNDANNKDYTVNMDDKTKKLIESLKLQLNTKIQVKGTLVEKVDGTSLLKIDEYTLAGKAAGK